MIIQQQYYTSCRKIDKSGFQVKAESKGIDDSTRQLLNQLIGYQIPYSSDASAINIHPIALRYFARDNLAFLISSQSCGKDEFGRDGNFFAHSLIGTPQDISNLVAPIFYWRSPFWVLNDTSEQAQLASLDDLDVEVSFDFDSIWSFLDQENRREHFCKLLCALLDYQESKRKIIILDDNEAIAMWIACVSMAFPTRYLKYLSFATYHHDPYTAPFIITGTTEDSSFRFTNDEYYSYFVLNYLHNRVSDTPESDYALHINNYFNAQDYEGEVLDFFYWLDRYDQSSLISKNLNNYTHFRLATTHKIISSQSLKVIESAQCLISELYSKTSFDDDDLIDLRLACQLLGDAVLNNQISDDLLDSYIQSLEGLKERDKNFLQTISTPLRIYLNLVINKFEQESETLWHKLETIYPYELLIQQLNQKDSLQEHVVNILSQDPVQILLFWKIIGLKLQLTRSTEDSLAAILIKSFIAIPNQESNNEFIVPDLMHQLMDQLVKIPNLNAQFILERAGDYTRNNLSSALFKWVYYNLVSRVSIEQRAKDFWPLLKQYTFIQNLHSYELKCDLISTNNINKCLIIIESWILNVEETEHSKFLTEAIDILFNRSDINRKDLSLEILTHQTFKSILEINLRQNLITRLMTNTRIVRPDDKLADLYGEIIKEYHSAINPAFITIIRGSLDLYYQQLTDSAIDNYREHFKRADEERYQNEAGALLEEFFASKGQKINPIYHFNVVRATYVSKHRDSFWNLYWSNFSACLLRYENVEASIAILDYWFNIESHLLGSLPYFVPEFFMKLPDFLGEVRKVKDYNKIKDRFEGRLNRMKWLKVIEPIINDKSSKGMLGFLKMFK